MIDEWDIETFFTLQEIIVIMACFMVTLWSFQFASVFNFYSNFKPKYISKSNITLNLLHVIAPHTPIEPTVHHTIHEARRGTQSSTTITNRTSFSVVFQILFAFFYMFLCSVLTKVPYSFELWLRKNQFCPLIPLIHSSVIVRRLYGVA